MARLASFIKRLGISHVDTRDIVGRTIASDPSASHGDLLAKARTWMLIALS